MYYEYLTDKGFLCEIREFSGKIMQSLCHFMKEDYDIGTNFFLVGSGAKNLITQKGNEPIDLDYNLEILRCEDFNDYRYLKECARKSFDKALRLHITNYYCYHLSLYFPCEDSKTVLRKYLSYNNTKFMIEVCIVRKDKNGNYLRLIRKNDNYLGLARFGKTNFNDEYNWDIAPHSKKLKEKVRYIKQCGKWELVRTQYINIKNRYLKQNTKNNTINNLYSIYNIYNKDKEHPSFICYIEAVNNVYNSRNNW